MQTGLRHQGQKPRRLECNCLAARIRPCYDQGPVIVSYGDIYRDYLLSVYERVLRRPQVEYALLVYFRFLASHLDRQPSLGHEHIEFKQKLLIIFEIVIAFGNAFGQLCEYPVDLSLFI